MACTGCHSSSKTAAGANALIKDSERAVSTAYNENCTILTTSLSAMETHVNFIWNTCAAETKAWTIRSNACSSLLYTSIDATYFALLCKIPNRYRLQSSAAQQVTRTLHVENHTRARCSSTKLWKCSPSSDKSGTIQLSIITSLQYIPPDTHSTVIRANHKKRFCSFIHPSHRSNPCFYWSATWLSRPRRQICAGIVSRRWCVRRSRVVKC
mmetsp:Transcript_11047/g.21584  ORF Transcript_11047/g.21584 Transcript_11047/m.21584 type:complete len:211 (-) Transcript_11047:400-1032(-)